MNSGAPGLPSIFRVDSDVTHAEDEGGDAAHLRQAVIEGDEGLVRELLDHGADIEAADIVGRRALHQAVFRSGIKRNSITLAKLLLDCGANVEATTYDGEKPLWIAAKHGTVAMAKMLLERGADVESFNPKSGTTALFEAVNRGHVGLIELLLESGADIDARPLASHDASRRQDVGGRMSPESPDLVLTGAPRYSRHHRHYGGKELRPGAGHGHGDGSKAKTKYSLLDYLAGKSASKKDDVTEELEVRPAKRKRRTGSVYRRATTSHGGHEHAYPTPAPDLPPERFTDSGPGAALPRRGDVPTAQPHAGRELPLHQAVANGHAEVVKLLLQHGADPGIRDKNGRTAKQVAEQQDLEELATLFRTGPVLEGPAITSDKGKQREVPLVIPAPHPTPRNNPAKMAACQAFEATIIEFYTEEREQRYQQSATIYDLLYGKGPDEILSERRPESLQPRQADFTWYHLPANNMEWVEGLMAKLSKSHDAATTVHVKLKEELGTFRQKEKTAQTPRPSSMKPHCREIIDDTALKGPYIGALSTSSTNSSIHAIIPYLHFEHYTHHQRIRSLMADLHVFGVPERGTQPNTASPTLPTVHPYEHLIRGYYAEATGKIGGWDPRCSLDGYYYNHLPSTTLARRDGDQVVLRYTKKWSLPMMIFMVDHLWMWIIGNHTIITCSALNWESWLETQENEAGETRSTYELTREDPMNVHQNILRHLKRPSRQPVTSVHDLACLITDFYTGLFHQQDVPDEFQFFDFFEREVARLNDFATYALEDFRHSFNMLESRMTKSIDIRQDLAALIEAQDVLDELGILRSVLTDQNNTTMELQKMLASKGRTGWDCIWATQSHLQRVDRMQKMAVSAKESMYHLLDLKQKHANFAEAKNSRTQAEQTTTQTRLAAENSRVTANQLKMMTKQAEETGRQGKTLMVFTVVTITFLPSSFMAAVFAINLDSLPLDSNDRLPLGYFLKYLFATSCAITIPLILIAFNLPGIISWWGRLRHRLKYAVRRDPSIFWLGVVGPFVALAVEGAVVAAIFTAPLGSAVKAAVTACISVIVAVALICMWVYAWTSTLNQGKPLGYTDSDASSSASSNSVYRYGWQ